MQRTIARAVPLMSQLRTLQISLVDFTDPDRRSGYPLLFPVERYTASAANRSHTNLSCLQSVMHRGLSPRYCPFWPAYRWDSEERFSQTRGSQVCKNCGQRYGTLCLLDVTRPSHIKSVCLYSVDSVNSRNALLVKEFHRVRGNTMV